LKPEDAARLFQAFTQIDSSTTREYGGTGLGLSIIKRLVELMGGAVGVESEPGKGATFWFTLPLEPLDPIGRTARTAGALLGKRALVVDDNATNRGVLTEQLARMGLQVAAAADGPQALRILQQAQAAQQGFDVALLDFQMPTLDGASLGEIVRADVRLADTRLVLLTSLDRAGDRQRFADIGFAAYLTKPVRARELRECLERVLAVAAHEWHLRSQPMVTRNVLHDSLGEARYSGKVLVVEDNAVNRQVTRKFLQRLGCTVQTVDDGLAAVAAAKQAQYHLILMDMQMPNMDGIAATRVIRAQERGQRVPIVALTANVLAGQLERCMEAGMDDFLAKPLEVERLREVLERFGLVATNLPALITPQASEDPVDLQRIAEIADDPEFAHELLATFIDSSRQIVAEVRAAMDAAERPGVARAAHKLKGASANIGARELQRLAAQLEAQAATDDGYHDTFAALVEQLTVVERFVKERI
jgi:two-component system, sensor histidine kinase and response regulator